jgi:hypothetical protein
MLRPREFSVYPWPVLKLRRFLALAIVPLIALSAAKPALAAGARKHRTTAGASHGKKRTAKKPAGQRAIDDSRATEIQTALVKAGYLTGEPSGHWDAQSQGAMVKFQSDNGWQTKLVPDSRALIKLGLGPENHSVADPSATSPTAPMTTTADAFPTRKRP